MDFNAITVLGPTASGKTRLAAQIAYNFSGEIISADSRQVYKGMDLGTGKDYEDYIVDHIKIPYYLIDIIPPSEEFNAFLFKEYFKNSYNLIKKRSKLPIICGGTGFYLSTIIQNYKLNQKDDSSNTELEKLSLEELKSLFLTLNKSPHNTTDLLDKNRIITALMILLSANANYIDTVEIKPFIIGINPGRKEIKDRISQRLKKRLDSGMIEEVKSLMNNGINFDKMQFFGLEYKYTSLYLVGKLNYNDMFQKLNSAIHNFAKRQMTWFRKMEKEGIVINWIESNDFNQAKILMESVGFRSN